MYALNLSFIAILRACLRRLALVFVCTILVFSQNAFAKTIVLPSPFQSQELEYDAKIQTIQPGDTLVFEEYAEGFFGPRRIKTHSFVVGDFLGQGTYTDIYALKDDPTKVIRISRSQAKTVLGTSYKYPAILTSMIDGYRDLVRFGVRTTKIFSYVRDSFIIAERSDGPTLLEFLTWPDRVPDLQRAEMTDALMRFFRTTANFVMIADFHPGQVAYDIRSKEWVLRDWNADHELIEKMSKGPSDIALKLKANSKTVKELLRTNTKVALNGEETRLGDWVNDLLDKAMREIADERERRAAEGGAWLRSIKSRCAIVFGK